MIPNQIFISYSHKDKVWLERLKLQLAPSQLAGTLATWEDTNLRPGQEWEQKIQTALNEAKVAVLLVSPDFLASDFISEQELTPLLEAAKERGLIIIWIPVRPSRYKQTVLANYQPACSPEKPLSLMNKGHYERELVKIADLIEAVLTESFSPTSSSVEEASVKALSVLSQQLFQATFSKEDIVKIFKPASPTAINNIFDVIKKNRTSNVHALPGVRDNKIQQQEHRQQIYDLIPLLEALIDIGEENPENNPRLHEYYAQLAFVYKDISNPQWKKTLEFINKAINQCGCEKPNLNYLVLYHFNKIICHINLEIEGIDAEKDYDIKQNFEWVWEDKGLTKPDEEGKCMLMTIPPLWAPNLREWMIENELERVIEGLKTYTDKQDEWFHSVPQEWADKLRERLNTK